MRELGVLDLRGYAGFGQDAAEAAPPTVTMPVCPEGQQVRRRLGQFVCAPAPGPQAAAARRKLQMQAADLLRKQAGRASYYRDQPGLTPGAQSLRLQRAHRANQAMVVSAQQIIGSPRVQTAYVDPLMARNTGVAIDVPESAAGKATESTYSSSAYTHKTGWMPGCKMVCPTGRPTQPMGTRMTIAYTGTPETELGGYGLITEREQDPGSGFRPTGARMHRVVGGQRPGERGATAMHGLNGFGAAARLRRVTAPRACPPGYAAITVAGRVVRCARLVPPRGR